MPDLKDGQIIHISDVVSVERETTPPKRYTEGDLPTVMQEAWKLVDDENEKNWLKETKGIGTTATRSQIIEGLKDQNLLTLEKKFIVPTEMGMWLYDVIVDIAPELFDIGSTTRFEERLDAIYRGEVEGQTVINEIANKANEILLALKTANNIKDRPKTIRPPTDKMIAFAKKFAKEQKIKIPANVLTDFDACKDFLPQRKENDNLQPSDKQISFARSLAEKNGIILPDEIIENPKELAAWIDQAIKNSPKEFASEKQMEWINKFVKQGEKAPPGFPDKVTKTTAKSYLDKLFNKKK